MLATSPGDGTTARRQALHGTGRDDSPAPANTLEIDRPLGTYTVFAAKRPFGSAELVHRYELQEAARTCVPDRVRLVGCLRKLAPASGAVEVRRSPQHGSVYYGGLLTCGLLWLCAVCAAKVAETRRAEVAAAVGSWRAAGGVALLLTYTYSHGPQDPLDASLSRFLTAHRAMTADRAFKRLRLSYGLQHSIKAVEVTWGAANGWHPHAHQIALAEGAVNEAELAAAMFPRWEAAAGRLGLSMSSARGLKVQATFGAVEDYLAKWGREPAKRPWSTADELVRAHTKRARTFEWAEGDQRYTPFDLLRWFLDTGEGEPVALFREYAGAFAGRHQLRWSVGLRDAVGLPAPASDDELAAANELGYEVLAQLTLDQWRAVRFYQRRGELLAVARAGDAGAVLAFAEELRRRYRVEVGGLYMPL